MSDDRELDSEKAEQNDAPAPAQPRLRHGAPLSVLFFADDEPETSASG